MPNFSCPSCKKVLKLNDGMSGKTVRCPACQTAFVVPKEEAAVVQTSITPAAPIMPAEPPPQAAAEPPKWEPDPRDSGGGERPARKKGKFNLNLKLDKKMLIMAGGGAGGLLVLFLLAAFVWPGFWLSARSSAVFRYLPPDSTFVGGINFAALDQAAFKKVVQNGLGFEPVKSQSRRDGPRMRPAATRELMQDAEWVIYAQGEQANEFSDFEFSLAVQKTKAVDVDAFRRKAKYGAATRIPFEFYKDKVVYPGRDQSLMYLPNPKLVTVQPGNAFTGALHGMIDNVQNSLQPEIESRIRSLERNAMWFAMTPECSYVKNFKWKVLGGQPPQRRDGQDDSAEKKDDEFKSARIALKNTKIITLTANPTSDNKGLKAEMIVECAKDEEAQNLEKALTSKKEKFADFLAGECPLNVGGDKKTRAKLADEIRAKLVDDFKAMEIKPSGARITVTATIGAETWDALKAWQEDREKAEKEEE